MRPWEIVAFLFAVVCILIGWRGPAHGQDCVEGAYGCHHEENHDRYRTWKSSHGMSCCEPMECRPVRSKQLEDGNWVWWNGVRWSLPVPSWAMLPPDILGDGRSHACGPRTSPEQEQVTYCFSPAESKG